jgi:hypothetical protein
MELDVLLRGLKKDYQEVSEKYEITNESRKKTEQELCATKVALGDLQMEYEDRERHIIKF